MVGRVMLGVVAGIVVLAGCGADPEPKISADPTPSASVSASASPVITEETPEQFATRWVKVDAEMQNSGETTAYRKLFRGCESCKKTADLVESYYDAGGFVRYQGASVVNVEGQESAGGPVVDVTVDAGRTEYKRSADSDTETITGGRSVYRLTLKGGPTDWRIAELTALAQ